MRQWFGSSLLSIALIACSGQAALAQAPASAPAAPAQTSPIPAPIPAPGPNMLVWMLDDVGFSQFSSYGGLVETPNIDRVAMRGLRYTNYHTAPICSASRAALLTGRNPHSVGIGGHAAASLPHPAHTGRILPEDGTIAANLREAGYLTMALGKWDHLPNADVTQAGPFTRWPTGQGFDKFYGFLSADADNWTPALVQDTAPVPIPKDANYHLNTDLADQAIEMINARSARENVPPFFAYFATGTAHAPHHAPQSWIEHYKGKFDKGWDWAREEILKRSIAKGLMPKGTKLAPRPEGMPAWSTLSADEKRLYARQMEVFAAAVSHADAEFGRILDALERTGDLDNTIVMITSDNGASAEGAFSGTYNESLFVNGVYPTAAENLPFVDKWGGPETQPHYSFGWAVAGNTPFRYYKQTTHSGGIRVPLVVSWPKGIAARGELRKQFVSVADVAPTLMEMAGVAPARMLNNVQQTPMEGKAFNYTFADPAAPNRKRAQYFELYGNKGLWADGWTIVTSHRLESWKMNQTGPFTEAWELYDDVRDPGQTTDLAARQPEKVKELAALFDEQAKQFNVYPLANMSESRIEAGRELRAEMMRRKGKWTYTGPIDHFGFAAVPPLSIIPFRMTAQVDLPAGDMTGPIFALGGATGGLGFYLAKNVPTFIFRDLAGNMTKVAADRALPTGASEVVLTFDRPAVKPMTPEQVTVTIAAGGQVLARKELTLSLPAAYGVSETFEIGGDRGSPISPDYGIDSAFPGTLGKVEFDFSPRAR